MKNKDFSEFLTSEASKIAKRSIGLHYFLPVTV